MEIPKPWFYGGCSFVSLLETEDKDGINDLMAILLVIFLRVWKAEPHYWHQTERTDFFFLFGLLLKLLTDVW